MQNERMNMALIIRGRKLELNKLKTKIVNELPSDIHLVYGKLSTKPFYVSVALDKIDNRKVTAPDKVE